MISVKSTEILFKSGYVAYIHTAYCEQLHTESEIFFWNVRTLKNKYDLTLCQSRLHTASETFVHQKKFGSGSIFCVFASVACILIGKDEEYEKRKRKFRNQCAMALISTPHRKQLPRFHYHSNCANWNCKLKIHLMETCQFHKKSHIYCKKVFMLTWGGFQANLKYISKLQWNQFNGISVFLSTFIKYCKSFAHICNGRHLMMGGGV